MSLLVWLCGGWADWLVGGGGQQVTGAELLRRLFEGELEEQRDRSIDEAIEVQEGRAQTGRQ